MIHYNTVAGMTLITKTRETDERITIITKEGNNILVPTFVQGSSDR